MNIIWITSALFFPAEDMDHVEGCPNPVTQLVPAISEPGWMGLDDVSVIGFVLGKVPSQLVEAESNKAEDDKGRDGSRGKKTNEAAKYGRGHCIGKLLGVATPNEFDRSVGESISADDKENRNGGRARVPETDDGELHELVVGVVKTPSKCYGEALVGVVAEEDEEGGEASHAIEVGRRMNFGWPDLLAHLSALEEAGDEEPDEANDGGSPVQASQKSYGGQEICHPLHQGQVTVQVDDAIVTLAV